MTTSLTDFLLARIAEDEEDSWIMSEGGARVRDECEAKRRIVEDLTDSGTATPDSDGNRLLGFLALPYADHPDYDETWRP